MCPTRSYPGIWELPINPLEIGEYSCPNLHSCQVNMTEMEIYGMLIHNFRRHYLSNRAPLALNLHSRWLRKPHHLEAFKVRIQYILIFDLVCSTFIRPVKKIFHPKYILYNL